MADLVLPRPPALDAAPAVEPAAENPEPPPVIHLRRQHWNPSRPGTRCCGG